MDTLVASIDISNALFKNAHADYLEVLLTQRDALESKLELIETKLRQFNSLLIFTGHWVVGGNDFLVLGCSMVKTWGFRASFLFEWK